MKQFSLKHFVLICCFLVFACSSEDSQVQQQDEMEDPTDDSGGGQQGDPEPTAFVVTSFSPTQAYTGETVTIVGDSIDLNTEYIVTFNDIVSPRVTVSETKLEAVIPNGEAGGIIKVQHDTFDVEVGSIEVIVENARIFGRDAASNMNVIITPNSGITNSTGIKRTYTDPAGATVWSEQVPVGQGFDVYYYYYNYRTETSEPYDSGYIFHTYGSSSNGQLFGTFSYEDYNGAQIRRLYKSNVAVPSSYDVLFDYPEGYNLSPYPVFIEATQTLYHQATVTGQSGIFVWKFNTDTLNSELIPYSNTFSQLTRSPDDRLVTIDNVNNTIVVLDENTLESTAILYSDIPQEYIESPVMFSFSTDRIFLATNTSIYIIDPITNARSEVSIETTMAIVFGIVNL
ncbi:MAG: hypothetical protein CMC13_03480 [Flavobacteriaceae bacterium]|nr:hypothetical protein [Flavobacteriaceae bacterium]|tara:strand:- start:28727 stop:29923 length:1197 start_codon:yes stop_codon:yes gene_type:complete